jgi:hypothetical protein
MTRAMTATPRTNLVGRLVARCDAETPSALENDCTVNTL